MLERRVCHLQVLGEVEALPERAGRDATMQNLSLGLLVRVLVACHKERVLLLNEFDLVGREAREGHRDTVVVLARPLDVVGRPVGRGLGSC
jgi:hypothetical protein